MREEDAQRFAFASEFVKGRVGAVNADMQALNGDLAKVVSADASTFDAKTGTRNEFMRALGRKLDLTVTGFNAFRTDPQLRQIRSDLADRADRTTFGEGKAAVSCPDPQLQMALHGVVKAIDQLPALQKPEIAAVEGSEATIEAFRRLTATFYGLLSFKMPPSADELRELQKKAIQSVENPNGASMRALSADEASGLSKRDYVPLAVALFVDLCLFLVSMGQRPGSRLDGLVPKMKAAERGPVIEILSRFNDIHRDKQVRENFELFRHVVFDMNGDYYVAVPLDAPQRLSQAERENLRVEAQLLANLFASFEREKVFKRTLLPTTASIQKRLARQGSKFASSDSFRVYKFASGAWSDIILGAVMGAAKRAEARRFEEGEAEHPENGGSHTPPPSLGLGAVKPAPEPEEPTLPFDGRPQPVPATTSSSIDPEHEKRFGPYATAYRPESEAPYFAAPRAARIRRPSRAPLRDTGLPVTAANSNTDAAAQPQAEANPATIIPIVRTESHHRAQREPTGTARREPFASLTLQRETATFTVPVSEAVMPSSLKSALARSAGYRTASFDTLQDVEALTPATDDAHFWEQDQTPADQEPLSASDEALFRRIAPPAAE
jgi:hypothetical protein